MDIKAWVLAARTHKSWTQAALAEKLGRSKANIGHWETGKHAPSLEQLGQISTLTGYPLPELGARRDAALLAGNVEAAPMLRAQVPLISWVRAGSFCEAMDPFAPGDAERWMDCPVNHSGSTFALRVRGDSMTAPHGNGRTYPEGCIIFVDPERRSPLNGERIVACLESTHEVTFKVYKNEDGRQWLQPLNPSHEPIRESFKVLGTVLGKWEDG